MKRAGRSNKLYLVAVLYLLVLGAAALTAPWIAPYDPVEQDLDYRLQPPGKGHLLGTDNFGRDNFSRIIYGSRSALMVGIISVGIAVGVGMVIGLWAGMSGGFTENVLMLIMDSILSFPTILLAITVVSFLGYGLTQVMMALGIIYSPVFARLVRAETLSIKTEEYVEAARALGTPVLKIIFKHIIPNLLGKVVVQASIIFALSVVAEASLSYLGLGTQPPTPSWGLLLKDARNYLIQAPWLAVYPGIILAFTVLAFNILGDTLSEKINPRLSGSI